MSRASHKPTALWVEKYYTLLVRHDHPKAQWSIEFGDWDRGTVADEADEYRSIATGTRTKIIATDGTQSAIDAKVAKLNSEA